MGVCGKFHASRTAKIAAGHSGIADKPVPAGRLSAPAATASRGSAIPPQSACARLGAGTRSASVAAEFHHKSDQRQRLVTNTPDAEAADLDQPGERRGRAHQQPSVHGFDMGAVVGHQPRERQQALAAPRRSSASASRDLPEPEGPGSARRARRPARPRHGSKAMCHAASLSALGSRARVEARAREPCGSAVSSRTPRRRCGSPPTAGRRGPR